MATMTHFGGPMRSGELAKLAGISSDSLRYYERRGLLPLPARAENGYRRYPRTALDRVLLIRRALGLGISVKELCGLLRVRDRGGVPCRNARSLLAGKLELLEDRLAELQALRQMLRDTLKAWDEKLASTPANTRAGLLEAVAPASSPVALHEFPPPRSSHRWSIHRSSR
jgi:DNA-binding transcriptional MerR regulator